MSLIKEIEGTKITFEHGEKSLQFDLLEIFDIDTENLSDEFATQASIFAYFSGLQAEAEHIAALAAFDRDKEFAMSDEFHRAHLDKREKKYTEAVIKSLVIRDEKCEKLELRFQDLDYQANLLKQIVRALAQRSEMLISLGAQVRQELSMTGMTMKEHAYEETINSVKKTLKGIKGNQV